MPTSMALGCRSPGARRSTGRRTPGETILYIFGFVTGLEARHSADTQKTLPAFGGLYGPSPNQATWASLDPWHSLEAWPLKAMRRNRCGLKLAADAQRRAIRER